jgi:hypothetical protein
MHLTQQTLKLETLVDKEESQRRDARVEDGKEYTDSKLHSLLPPSLSRSKYSK